MSQAVLKKIKCKGKLLSISAQHFLVIREDGVEFEQPDDFFADKRQFLAYPQIASVNSSTGMIWSVINFVNSGGVGNIQVTVPNSEATAVVEMVERRIAALKHSGHRTAVPTTAVPTSAAPTSAADEIRKLHDLKIAGILSETEFQTLKSRLMT